MTDRVDMPAEIGGAPSVEPGSTEAHSHPLSRTTRLLIALYGLVVALVGGTVLVLLFQADQRDQRQRDQILAEFDLRTERRDANDAFVQEQIEAQQEATRLAVCTFLTADFKPTPAVTSLSAQFNCQSPVPPLEGAAS